MSIYEYDPAKAVEWEQQIHFLIGENPVRSVESAVRHEQVWAGWKGPPFALEEVEVFR